MHFGDWGELNKGRRGQVTGCREFGCGV